MYSEGFITGYAIWAGALSAAVIFGGQYRHAGAVLGLLATLGLFATALLPSALSTGNAGFPWFWPLPGPISLWLYLSGVFNTLIVGLIFLGVTCERRRARRSNHPVVPEG